MSSTTSTTTSISVPTTSTAKASQGYSPSGSLTQYGFFFDQSRCTNCMSCAVACKAYLGLAPGPQKALRMLEWETGTFPTVTLNFLMLHCFHCTNPVCITAAVASGNPGIYKEPKYGAVLIDPAYSKNLRDAAAACPYGALAYASDDPAAPAVKCDMCIARLEQGRKPICVMSCQMRALDFDTMDNLKTKYGASSVQTLSGLPDPTTTVPALVLKAKDKKTPVIPYDPAKVLALWGNRDPLPQVYASPTLVTTVAAGVVKRNQPVVQPVNVDQVVKTSRSDEG